MTIYKLMNSRWLPKFVSGESVRVGTLSEFRKAETYEFNWNTDGSESLSVSSQNRGIGDRNEGAEEFVILDHVSKEGSSERELFKRQARALGIIDFKPGSSFKHLTVKNFLRRVEIPNHFIFCCTHSIDKKTVQALQSSANKTGGDPYDVAVPILDVWRFAESLAKGIQSSVKQWSGQDIQGDVIDYRNMTSVVGKNEIEPPTPNAFTKDLFFEHQREYRLLFRPNCPEDQNSINVNMRISPSMFGPPVFLGS